jgi:adhesin/invasin
MRRTWVLGAAVLLWVACANDPTGSGQPGSPATSTVTSSASAIASGATVAVELVVKDASGQPVWRGGDVVVFGLSGGTSTGRVSGTMDQGNGTHSATVVGEQAGTPMTVTASLNGDSVTTLLPTIAVVAGSGSPATSMVTVSNATLDVGASVEIILEARDAAGNRVLDGGQSVTFADSGGTSQGTIGVVTDHGDGSYSALYTGEAVGTAVVVLTTLDGQRVATPAPTLAVTAGPPSPATSELESSSDTIAVGGAATLTLRTRDAGGAPLSLGGRTVVFSVQQAPGSSDGVIEADTVDLGDGSYTARFRGTVAGDPVTIGASIDGEAITSPLPTVTVVPLEPSPQNSVVTIADTLLIAGDSTAVTLQVKDVQGNDLAASGLAVTFWIDSVGGASWGLTDAVPVIDNGDGSFTGWVLARASGPPAPVGATIDGTTVEMLDSLGVSQLPRLRVAPDSASVDSSTVSIDDSALDLGQITMVRLLARDRWGNDLDAGGATVTFPLVGPAGPFDFADVGPTVDLGDGRYQASVTATVDGGQPNWIRPTIDGLSLSDSVSVSVVCAAGPVDLGKSSTVVEGLVAGNRIPSGIPITIRFTARDAAGNCLLASGLTVGFATSGGSSTGTIGATVDNQDGTYNAIFIGELAGTATSIATTVDGAPLSSPAPTVVVTPGDVSAVMSVVSTGDSLVDAGTVVALQLQAHDAAGNPIDNDTLGLQVVFEAGGGTSTGTIGPTTSNGDGTYGASFTAISPGTPLQIGATIDGTPVATPPPTVEVGTIDPDSSLVLADGTNAVTVPAGGVVQLHLQARDTRNRHIRGAGRAVTFVVGGAAGQSGGTVGPVTDLGDGSYLATFTALVAGSATAVQATIASAPADATPPVITVVPDTLSLAASTVSLADPVLAVGGATVVTLVTRDAFGNQLLTGGRVVAFTLSGGTSSGTFGPVADLGDGSYTATFTATTAGTAAMVGATVDGTALTSPAPTVTVQ